MHWTLALPLSRCTPSLHKVLSLIRPNTISPTIVAIVFPCLKIVRLGFYTHPSVPDLIVCSAKLGWNGSKHFRYMFFVVCLARKREDMKCGFKCSLSACPFKFIYRHLKGHEGLFLHPNFKLFMIDNCIIILNIFFLNKGCSHSYPNSSFLMSSTLHLLHTCLEFNLA